MDRTGDERGDCVRITRPRAQAGRLALELERAGAQGQPWPRSPWCPGGVVLGSVLSLAATTSASAAPPVTMTFLYTGDRQVFTVPDAVTSLDITAQGAGGGSGLAPGDVGANPGGGGSGGQVTGS